MSSSRCARDNRFEQVAFGSDLREFNVTVYARKVGLALTHVSGLADGVKTFQVDAGRIVFAWLFAQASVF